MQPRNVLFYFVSTVIIYLSLLTPDNSKKTIVDFILIYGWFFPSLIIVLIISARNSIHYYNKNKKEFTLSLIPLLVIILFILYVIVSMVYLFYGSNELYTQLGTKDALPVNIY